MKTGLVLSGGGSRGIAHLGVIKALEEMGIKPDVIAGTSAGSIVGGFYAAGFSTDKMLEIALEKKIFHFPGFSWQKDGLLKTRSIINTCRMFIGETTFEQLNLPFTAAVTNLESGKTEYISTGDLATAITASSAVPGIFEPVKYNDRVYADGGILNNFPVEPLLGNCDVIIGVHVNPLSHRDEEMSIPVVLDRSFHMAIYNSVIAKADKCNVFIEPPALADYGLFEFKKTQEIYDAGYNYTQGMKEQIARLYTRCS
ncbi:MAG: hypothetical protein RLZZ367_314 [Bacteroidota bacterium]|jgi:NTE family protein